MNRMHDLNLNLLYRTSFEIRTVDEEGDALWQLVYNIRTWMTSKWRNRGVELDISNDELRQFKWHAVLTSSDEDQTVRLESASYISEGGTNNWACAITETYRVPGKAPRQWVTEIGFAYSEQNAGTVSLVLSYGDYPGFLGPCQDEPNLGLPRIIRMLINDPRLVAETCGMPVSLEPRELRCGDFQNFWQLLESEERQVPVIYISHRSNDGEPQNLIDPEKVAAALGPSALVYYTRDDGFAAEMRDNLPNFDYRCYMGFVRVYAPGLDASKPWEHTRHRFFNPDAIEEIGEGAFIEMLRRALAQDVHFYEDMVRLDVVKTKLHRSQIVRRGLELAAQKADAAENEAFELMDDLEEEMELLQEENARIKEENATFKQDLYSAESRAQAAEAALSGRAALPAEEPALGPITPTAVAKVLLSAYPGRLDFTERGWKTLKECEKSPELVFHALYDLVAIAYDLYANGTGDIAKAFNSQSEFDFARGAGMMTRKNSGMIEQYRDTYLGNEINVETHIKKGSKEKSPSFIRVYFAYVPDARKIVVSHIGEHLENYTAQFIN